MATMIGFIIGYSLHPIRAKPGPKLSELYKDRPIFGAVSQRLHSLGHGGVNRPAQAGSDLFSPGL